MNSERSKPKREFQVICIWCGVKIRRDKSENALLNVCSASTRS